MKKILITGGTTFVSKYAAKYFVEHGYDVYVVNRNSKPQVKGVTLIESDRHNLGDKLKNQHFDMVLWTTSIGRRLYLTVQWQTENFICRKPVR